MSKKKKSPKCKRPSDIAYHYNAINQPDERQEKTNVAMPNDENVERAKNWVDFNEK